MVHPAAVSKYLSAYCAYGSYSSEHVCLVPECQWVSMYFQIQLAFIELLQCVKQSILYKSFLKIQYCDSLSF